MRILAAMTLLLAVSCTFDYGALKGAPAQGDGGADAGARDVLDAPGDVPAGMPGDAEDAAGDTVTDAGADEGPAAVDASGMDIPDDVPVIVTEDAAPDGEPSTGGSDGSGTTESGGTAGRTSVETGGVGGSVGGATATGGVVSSGGAGGAAGVTALGGTSKSTSGTGGRTGGKGGNAGTGGAGGSGGITTSGGVGGTVVDAGVDRPAEDASDDSADGAVDVGEGDAPELPSVIDILTATPTGTEFSSTTTQNQMKIDYYSVNKSVTLLKIEQYLTPAALGTPLHWVVYRSSMPPGTNSYVLLGDFLSTSTLGSGGYQSSPPINIVLEAGASYAIGVYWLAYSTTYWYHNSGYSVAFPIATSFGGVTSGVASTSLGGATISWSTPANMYYPQRLTTR